MGEQTDGTNAKEGEGGIKKNIRHSLTIYSYCHHGRVRRLRQRQTIRVAMPARHSTMPGGSGTVTNVRKPPSCDAFAPHIHDVGWALNAIPRVYCGAGGVAAESEVVQRYHCG